MAVFVSIKRYNFVTGFFFLTFLFGFSAQANERVVFGQSLAYSSAKLVGAYVQKEMQAAIGNFDIALADLNEDGVNEFILKEKACEPNKRPCAHSILAEGGETVISLGEINARDIFLSSEYSNGIRNILALKSGNNDYDYSLYVWEPKDSQYILLE